MPADVGVVSLGRGGRRVIRPIPEWWWLYQSKNWRQSALACSIESKWWGNSDRYLSVSTCASLLGVVGRGVGPAVRFQDAEVGEQERDRFASHRGDMVGVSWPRSICCCSTAWPIRALACSALSRRRASDELDDFDRCVSDMESSLAGLGETDQNLLR